MTEKDNRIFLILQYLNQSHIRKNQRLTEDILRSQFDFTKYDFDETFKKIVSYGYVYRREGTEYIVISPDSETKFNDLYTDLASIQSKKGERSARVPRQVNYGSVTVVLTIIGGSYILGFQIGSVKYDREKIELQRTVDSLNARIKELEQDESQELKTFKD